jgi:hypothetical protein
MQGCWTLPDENDDEGNQVENKENEYRILPTILSIVGYLERQTNA